MPSVHITRWDDLRASGFELLTGEACGLNLRILFDVTEKGRLLFCKVFGLDPSAFNVGEIKGKKNSLGEAWNAGPKADPHVGSVMLNWDDLPKLSIFAALETPGVKECWISYKDGQWNGTYGFAASDLAEKDEWLKVMEGFGNKLRRYSYGGTAGDRNRHVFSGRVS